MQFACVYYAKLTYILIHGLFFVYHHHNPTTNRCVQDCEGQSPCGGPKPEHEDAYIDVYACCASQPWVEECAATPGPTPPPKPTKPPTSPPTPRPSTMKPTGKPTEPQPTKVSPILVNNAALCIQFFVVLSFSSSHYFTKPYSTLITQDANSCTNNGLFGVQVAHVNNARRSE